MRHILILFLSTIALEVRGQQHDFLRPHYQEYNSTTKLYGAISPFETEKVSSDFGPRRLDRYNWHSGLDFTCGDCENNLVLASYDGTFYYNSTANGLRYVIIDGTADLAYLHLFTSTNAGNCHILELKNKPTIKVVLTDYTKDVKAFSEEAGQVEYNAILYDVGNYIHAGEALGAVGSSGTSAVHLHLEELPDGTKNVAEDDVSKNPLQSLHYDSPQYSEIQLYYSETKDLNAITEGIQILYPGTKQHAILIRPQFPNSNDGGQHFATINDVNRVGLYIRNTSFNENWESILGSTYRSEFHYGGKFGETCYPTQLLTGPQGSFQTTGIYPAAYASIEPKEFDNFLYCDFYPRIHADDPMKGKKFIVHSNCPANSRYPDGVYDFKSSLENIRGQLTEGSVYSTGIDNFQPFVQSVFVLVDGINVYSSSWECQKVGPEFSGYECKTSEANPYSIITIHITTSEPMFNLSGRINEFPGTFLPFDKTGILSWTKSFQNFNYLKNGDKGHLEFAGIDINHNHLLDMRAISGGTIQSNKPVKIPIKDFGANWKPIRRGGDIDNVHEFCFMKCHDFRDEDVSEGILFSDCLRSSDLKLSFDVESFNGAGDGWIHLEVSGGVSPYFIQWTDEQGKLIKQGSNVFDLTSLHAGIYCYRITDAECCELSSCAILCPSIIVSAQVAITQPHECMEDNGQIRVINAQASGGTGTYDFHLEDIRGNRISKDANSNQYEELFSGKYFLIATDENGCTGFYTIELKSSKDFYIRPVVQHVCPQNLGSIYVEAFSPNYPDDVYHFEWSTGFEENGVTESQVTYLDAGNYCVIITSESTQCSQQECFEIRGTGKPLSMEHKKKIPCANNDNGEIQLTVTGGNKPYQYKWSNGDFRSYLNQLKEGNYCVTVSDACGISEIECFDLTDILKSKPKVQYDCPDYIDVFTNASGGNPPYNYRWSNGSTGKDLISVPIDVIYEVTITDQNGCRIIKQVDPNPVELINPIKACQGFWDGEITIRVNNPDHKGVYVSYDYKPCDDCTVLYKIYNDHSDPVEFRLNDLAGDKEYHFYVSIDGCLFEIKFTLGEENLREEFSHYDESGGIAQCVYDLVCRNNVIDDGRSKAPDLKSIGGNCKKFLFKECAKVEVRCMGYPNVVKTIPGKKIHMRRLEAIEYARRLGIDPTALSGNFCDHLWICHDDPLCIIATARGELGGNFKGIVRDGDCYKVKCRSFFGLINQDYRICGEDFIPEDFLPYYRKDIPTGEPGNKSPKTDCVPLTLNFTDVLECWAKFVAEDGKKFYDSEMAKLVDSYRDRNERYCAWVSFCTGDFSILKTNIHELQCKQFNPPIVFGNWLVNSTCTPHRYEGHDIVFCECDDPDIIQEYGICLEPKRLPNKCTIAAKQIEEPGEIQFLPFQYGNTNFNSFSPFQQLEGFTTINGIISNAQGVTFYQKYVPGEIYHPLEAFSRLVYIHQDAKHNKLQLITSDTIMNAYSIHSGDFNHLIENTISCTGWLEFISIQPGENKFSIVGRFQGGLTLNSERITVSNDTAIFILDIDDQSQLTHFSWITGARILNRQKHKANTFILERLRANEPLHLNDGVISGNTITYNMKFMQDGTVTISEFEQHGMRILAQLDSKNKLNHYLLALVEQTFQLGDTTINLPKSNQIALIQYNQNGITWIYHFDQTGIGIEDIFLEETRDLQLVVGLNVGLLSSLFKTEPQHYYSVSDDIVILQFDSSGNLNSQKRFGSPADDELLKDLYYSDEHVLYLGGELKGLSSLRQIGDVQLIKSQNIQYAAFISYMNLNEETNTESRKNADVNGNVYYPELDFNIYPNPANEILTIEFGNYLQEILRMEIYNSSGMIMRSYRGSTRHKQKLDISDLSNGVYFLKVVDKKGFQNILRFIKTE